MDPARLADLPLPWSLSEAVLRRLDDLTEAQRRVVDAAAILGRRIPFDLLAAVTGSGEDELIASLRHLVAGNVMVEEEPDTFAFRHALTREAIAQQGSTAEALRLAETRLSEAGQDLDLLAAASKAAWMIGLLQLAIEHGERWHEVAAATGDPTLEAAALIHLARLYWEARDFQLQWRTVWAALAEAVGCPAVRAAALGNKGTALSDSEDGHDQGVAMLERAIAEAEAGELGYVLHRGLHNLFMQEVGTWPPERSRRVLRRIHGRG